MIWTTFFIKLLVVFLIALVIGIPVFFFTEWGKEKFRKWNSGYKANVRKYGMSKNEYKRQQKKKLKRNYN